MAHSNYQNNIISAVIEPLTVKQSKNYDGESDVQKKSENSKCIDLILVKNDYLSTEPAMGIYVIDATIRGSKITI